MYTMQDIEALTKTYAGAREELRERLQALREELERARRARIQGIKNSLARLTAAHDELLEAISDSPGLFDRPKTHILHGVRVGWMKRKGAIEYADVERTIELIEKHLADKAPTLIKVKKTPIAAAIAELPGRELKTIGVTLKDDVDTAFIKPVGDELDKLMKALLKDREEAAAEEALA